MVKRTNRKPSVWWVSAMTDGVLVASLAANGNAAIMDEAIDHPATGEDYGPGAIIGLRARVAVYTAASILSGRPIVVLQVLPNGISTPTVSSAAALKQNEKYIWGLYSMTSEPGSGSVTDSRFVCDIAPRTARRFEPGDRIVLTVVNLGNVAFGASARETIFVDTYLKED